MALVFPPLHFRRFSSDRFTRSFRGQKRNCRVLQELSFTLVMLTTCQLVVRSLQQFQRSGNAQRSRIVCDWNSNKISIVLSTLIIRISFWNQLLKIFGFPCIGGPNQNWPAFDHLFIYPNSQIVNCMLGSHNRWRRTSVNQRPSCQWARHVPICLKLSDFRPIPHSYGNRLTVRARRVTISWTWRCQRINWTVTSDFFAHRFAHRLNLFRR